MNKLLNRDSVFAPLFVLPLVLSTSVFIIGVSVVVLLTLIVLLSSLVVQILRNLLKPNQYFFASLITSSFITAIFALIFYFKFHHLFLDIGPSLCFLSVSQAILFNNKKLFSGSNTIGSILLFSLKRCGVFALMVIGIAPIREILSTGFFTYGFGEGSSTKLALTALVDNPIPLLTFPVLIFLLISLVIFLRGKKGNETL